MRIERQSRPRKWIDFLSALPLLSLGFVIAQSLEWPGWARLLFAFGWLVFMTMANIRGARMMKLIVAASDAQDLLPRAVTDKSSAVCRGGWTHGEWHGPCAWQDRCWGAA